MIILVVLLSIFLKHFWKVVYEFIVEHLIISFIPSDEKKLNQNRSRNGKVRVVLYFHGNFSEFEKIEAMEKAMRKIEKFTH